MKQIFQHLRNGVVEMAEIAIPSPGPNEVVIQSRCSIISPGTERMLAEFALASPMQKALQQPERVRQVFQKLKTDGFGPTIAAVKSKLANPIPVGYSNAGVVIALGTAVTAFRVGDRVVSNGPHAEVVCVPATLCASIPSNVADESAAFTVLGAISLQGVRLLKPTLGECVVVQGLGLLGLIACQILKANGCVVCGFDIDRERVALAQSLGIDAHALSETCSCSEVIHTITHGRGADAVLVAAASRSDTIIHDAATMCRKQGRIVLIGTVGLNLDRRDFYEKEISFQVSCSYGPGRYDPVYEDKGVDYPLGFVRWTAQRNFEAVLHLLSTGALVTTPLISAWANFQEADRAYQDLLLAERNIGVAFRYETPAGAFVPKPTAPSESACVAPNSQPRIGLIGAGQFASSVLCPALAKLPVTLALLCSSMGANAAALAKRYGFQALNAEPHAVFSSDLVDTVFIATRNNSHAELVEAALNAGKRVFVEKPLALSSAELRMVLSAARAHPSQQLMVGFNRRFSPLVVKARELLAESAEPRAITMTINAGFIDPTHWTHDREIGGGRLLGEACHFLDLVSFLGNAPIRTVHTSCTRGGKHDSVHDIFSVNLQLANGSIGTVHYFANGSKEISKEKMEIFCGAKVIQIDNFRDLRAYGFRRSVHLRLRAQDKGHSAEIAQFIDSVITGRTSPIPIEALENSSWATLAAHASLFSGSAVTIEDFIRSEESRSLSPDYSTSVGAPYMP